MAMPEPTNEQAVMQQKMMKYMTGFMGLLFYKVASGLCLYFIASSLWGIGERKLLPKAKTAGADRAAGREDAGRNGPRRRPATTAATAARARKKAPQGQAEEVVASRSHVLRSRRHDRGDRHGRRRRGAGHGASQRAGNAPTSSRECFVADNAAEHGPQLVSDKSCVRLLQRRRATAVTGQLDVRLDDASHATACRATCSSGRPSRSYTRAAGGRVAHARLAAALACGAGGGLPRRCPAGRAG